MLIQANKINKNFGYYPVLEEVSLTIHSGEKVGLIGPNGSGKSTLLEILAKESPPDQGTVSYKKELVVGYIQQKVSYTNEKAYQYVLNSFQKIKAIQERLQDLEQKMKQATVDLDKILAQYARIQEEYEQAGGYTIEDRIVTTFKGLNIAHLQELSMNELSGGEQVRIELAKILLLDVDVYLLDEPTNHLDIEGIAWLENFITHTKSAVVIISHDRHFLDETVKKIVSIEDSQIFDFKGNYSQFRSDKEIRMELLEKDYELQQKEMNRIKTAIKRFRQWGNEGDNEKFFKKAKELERRLEKIDLLKRPDQEKNKLEHQLIKTKRSGKEVVKAEKIGKIFGEHLLFSDSNFMLFREEKIILTGKNGSGKTTLLNLILGKQQVDEGVLKVGESVKIGYLPQIITFKNTEQRLIDYMKQSLPNEQTARQYLAKYHFYASDVSKRLKDLSGGEVVRLKLAEIFLEPINFLILDEPTNHLDIETREEIELIIKEFKGALLVISHDRYFIEKYFSIQLLISDETITKQLLTTQHYKSLHKLYTNKNSIFTFN